MMSEALLDKQFLKQLDETQEKEIYAKIISMSLDEEPLEEISGAVTTGSISVDGKSAVRRTCSLTITTDEININSFYWGLHTKFKLYIGLKNKINNKYPDIIWFPEGTYVITTFNTSQAVNNYSISIQGKDKMTFLNGEIGGTITALTHDFGTFDTIDEFGQVSRESNLIKDIIRDAVHELGHEPFQNIIINDLDDCGLELMEYRGEDPLYFIIDPEKDTIENMYQKDPVSIGYIRQDGKTNMDDFVFNPLFELDLGAGSGNVIPTKVKLPEETGYKYEVAKISYGETAGYKITNLTYAGDLICNAGESVTSMLDKIVKMLGDYEYFYDLDGHFIFQRQRTYTSTSWSSIVNNQDEQYIQSAAYTSAVQYSFENSKIITSFANNPAYTNLKNDFSIWGARKGITGIETPVHMRYAIDKKPKVYTSFDGFIYTTMTKDEYIQWATNEAQLEARPYDKKPNSNGLPDDEWWELKDWSEFYKFRHGTYPTQFIGQYTQSAIIKPSDYFELHPEAQPNAVNLYNKSTSLDDLFILNGKFYNTHGSVCGHTYTWFLTEQYATNPDLEVYFRIPNGIERGGKPYNPETDIKITIDENKLVTEIDWRELIYQMAIDYRRHNREPNFNITLYNNNPQFVKNGLTGYENYYTDLEGFWRQIYYPGYLGTFESEPVTSQNFAAKKDTLYFQRPIYKQCQKNEAYHDDIVYYTRTRTARKITGSQVALRGHEDLYGHYGVHDEDLLSPFVKIDKNETYYVLIDTYTEAKNLTRVQFVKNTENYFYGTTDTEWCYCQWYGEKSFNEDYNYAIKTMNDFDLNTYWKTDLMSSPESLNFWFDFLDSENSELGKYGVQVVGSRSKSANDNTVKAIYFRETPTVIFQTAEEAEAEIDDQKLGYSYIQLSNDLENLFTISSQGKSAKSVLDEWLYQYSYCTESVTISALPVYYLQPNTRIYISDKLTGINGEYIVSKITLPLTAKGTMSITATKAVDRIY